MPLAAPAALGAHWHSPLPVGIGWRHPHYQELLARQPNLDFLEVHSENFFGAGGAALAVLKKGRDRYPISLHGVGLSLGSAIGIDDWHLEQLARLVQQVDPVRVSDHACFARGLLSPAADATSASDRSAGDGSGTTLAHASDLLPIPFTEEALAVLCANVQRAQDRLKRPFMVENLSAYFAWKPTRQQGFQFDPSRAPLPHMQASDPLAESAFLAELARRTGCALLVDVNNLYVNALNAQIAGVAGDPVQHCQRWLDGIEPTTVGELHLAGHCRFKPESGESGDAPANERSGDLGDIVIDDHGSPVCDAVWRVYQHAVQRFGPVPTLVEWDTNVPALDVLLQEVDRARAVANLAPRSTKWPTS